MTGSAGMAASTPVSALGGRVAAGQGGAPGAAVPALAGLASAASSPSALLSVRAAPADAVAADPAELLAAAHVLQATAWRELALRWNVAIGEGDPCVAATQAQLACFRSPAGGLTAVRQMGRPGVLTLRPPTGPAVHAVLVALDERQATLQVGPRRYALTLPALVSLWRGEFSTFWRTPPGWREGVDATVDPRGREWIDRQLTAAGFAAARPMFERVWGFQQTQGLQPDGLAGPMTLMRMNRAAGVDEPRLATER